jgi:hypothetical protein
MEYVFPLVVFALCVAVVVLWDRNADLRWRLDMSKHDAERWKGEAVKRGYKNPFEEVIDSLRKTSETLKAVAGPMKRITEIQKASSERLREINAKLSQANASMAAANADLTKAGGHFSRAARPLLPPPPARLSLSAANPKDRAANEAVRKLERDVLADFGEPDPRKRN